MKYLVQMVDGGIEDIKEDIECEYNDYSTEYTPMGDYEYEREIYMTLTKFDIKIRAEEVDELPLHSGEFMKFIIFNLDYIKSITEEEFFQFTIKELSKFKVEITKTIIGGKY